MTDYNARSNDGEWPLCSGTQDFLYDQRQSQRYKFKTHSTAICETPSSLEEYETIFSNPHNFRFKCQSKDKQSTYMIKSYDMVKITSKVFENGHLYVCVPYVDETHVLCNDLFNGVFTDHYQFAEDYIIHNSTTMSSDKYDLVDQIPSFDELNQRQLVYLLSQGIKCVSEDGNLLTLKADATEIPIPMYYSFFFVETMD